MKKSICRQNNVLHVLTCSSASRARAACVEPSRLSSSALREALLSLEVEDSAERALKLDRRSVTRPRAATSSPAGKGNEITKEQKNVFATLLIYMTINKVWDVQRAAEKRLSHQARSSSLLHWCLQLQRGSWVPSLSRACRA